MVISKKGIYIIIQCKTNDLCDFFDKLECLEKSAELNKTKKHLKESEIQFPCTPELCTCTIMFKINIRTINQIQLFFRILIV